MTSLPWVKSLDLTMDARPPAPLLPDDSRPNGLRSVAHVIAVSSCKGGEVAVALVGVCRGAEVPSQCLPGVNDREWA